ncbi:MAG: zinc-binding dehydrogenase [Candidatus Hermodarchaeota archaeon]
MSSEKENGCIPALIFELKKFKLLKAFIKSRINPKGFWKSGGPISLKYIPYPKLIAEDWVIVKTVFCGICGSDMTELRLSGSLDNPIRSFISFPQIMGHEPVGIIESVGHKVKKFKKGDRVVIDPWFSCVPRGILPICSRCSLGDFKHCHNFQKGKIPKGMHLGVTRGYGGFSPYFTVHESQCFLIPEKISFEQAVLADPFSVSFHSLLSLNPSPESQILVYGLGVIGLLTILCLKNIFKVKHVIAIGRYQFQKDLAIKLGADHVFLSSGDLLIEEIANYNNFELYTPKKGLNWTLDGVNGIVDTIASAETFEIGERILCTQGKLVFFGVSTPKRFENTLHYFKELEVIGSNAFGIEIFQGESLHAFQHFLKFLSEGLIDPKMLVTHKFRCEEYKIAFNILANKSESHAIKVVFEFDNNKY